MAEIIRLNVENLAGFRKAMAEAGDDIQKQAKVLARFKSDNKGATPIEVVYGVKNKGKGVVKEIRAQLNQLSAAEENYLRILSKATSTERQSLTASRQRLAQAKKELNSLSSTSDGYAKQQKRVETLTRALQYREGIQLGSVASLRAERTALQDLANNTVLAGTARDQFNQALLSSNENLRRAQGIEKGSIADLRARKNELQALTDQYALGSDRQRQYAKEIDQINRVIRQQAPLFQRLITSLNQIATVQAGFTAISSFAQQLNGLINQFTGRVKQVENFRLAIQNVGFSISETSAFFDEAANTAIRLGAPVTQVEQAYRRMIPALQGAGISSADSTKFIEALTARTQTLGLSADQSGRLVEAFAQVLSKGKLQAEELNQQISEADGAFRTQFAEALGITVERLSELTKQGDVTSKEFVKGVLAMQNGVETLAAKVAEGNLTVQQLQNTISTINTKAIEAIGKNIEPAIRAILGITLAVQKFVAALSQTQVGQLIAKSFNEALLGIEAFVKTLLDAIQVVTILLTPVANLLTLLQENIGGFGSITRAIIYFTGVAIAANLAVVAFTKSLTLAAAIAGGRFASSWAIAGGALLNFASIAKSILFLDFVGAFRTARTSVASLSASFLQAGGSGGKLTNTFRALAVAARTSNGSFRAFASNFATLNQGYRTTAAGAKITSDSMRQGAASATAQAVATDVAAEALGAAAGAAIANGLANAKAAKITGDVVGATTKAGGAAAFFSRALATMSGWLGALIPTLRIALAVITKWILPLTLGIAAIQAIVNQFKAWGDASDAIGKKTEALTGKLKQQGFIVKQAENRWKGLGDTLKFIFVDFFGILPKIANIQLNSAIIQEFKALQGVINQVNAKLLENGFAWDAVTGQIDFAAGKYTQSAAAIKATKDTLDEQIAAIDELIKEKSKDAEANAKIIQQLNGQKNALQEQAAYYGLLINRLKDKNEAIEEAIKGETNLEKKIRIATKALEERNKAQETDAKRLTSQAQNMYIRGLITEGQLQVYNAQLAATRTANEIEGKRQLLALLEKEARNATNNVDRYKLEEEIKKEINNIEAAKVRLGEQIIAVREAEIKLLDEEIAKAGQIVSIFDTVRDTSLNVASQIGSALSSSVDKIKEGITQAAKIEFLATFDESALRRASNARQRLGALEFKIERIKLETERAIQISSLRRVAAEQRLLALKLRAEGDTRGAALANASADAIERQIPALNAAFNLQSSLLSLEERGYQATVNKKRELAGLPPLFQGVIAPTISEYENLETTLGGVVQSYQDVSNTARGAAEQGAAYYQASTQQIAGYADQRYQNEQALLQKLLQIQEQYVGKFEEILNKLGEYEIKEPKPLTTKNIEEYKTIADKLFGDLGIDIGKVLDDLGRKIKEFSNPNNFSGFIKGVQDAVRWVNELFKPRQSPTFDPFGPSNNGYARWMGGPVAAGQTYTVNDGGGREGFVDKFNNFKMLPAGRNIKWTPTSSGTVIPAHLVDQFKQSMAATKIESSNSGPSFNMATRNANVGLDSGNLVKQIGSVMAGSGGNQRITNNVTIQSQAPVMDASRIMANVNRLRKRRRGL